MSSLTSNPFATRYVVPGQVDWVGAEDYFEKLASRWISLNCRASIVGVHGSGKSTLLEHFVPQVADVIWRRDAEGNMVNCEARVSDREYLAAVWLQLRKSISRSMIIPWEELRRGRLLILDGYEQLTRWRRAMLVARTALRGVKLLVTCHRHTVLPTLCELSISATTARQIVEQLTASRGDWTTIGDEEMTRRLQVHGGNMREVLMELYDRFEELRVVGAPKVKSES